MDTLGIVMTVGGLVITVVVVGGTLLLVFRVLGGLSRAAAQEQHLLQTGMPARARILDVQMGGMSVSTGAHRRLQVVMTLEVHPSAGAPYHARVTPLVSELHIPQIQPGGWLAVRVNPSNPQQLAIEAFGVGPAGAPGSPPGYGAPPAALGYQPGAAPYAPAGYGVPPAGYGAPPAGYAGMPVGIRPQAFKMPLGAKIGLIVGLVGAVIGIGVAIVAVFWTSGIGGPSDVCTRAAACCRRLGNSPACDNYLSQTGPIADKVCEESLKGFQRANACP